MLRLKTQDPESLEEGAIAGRTSPEVALLYLSHPDLAQGHTLAYFPLLRCRQPGKTKLKPQCQRLKTKHQHLTKTYFTPLSFRPFVIFHAHQIIYCP